MTGTEETVAPQEVQGTEVKPKKREWGGRFKDLSLWNRVLTTIAIFVFAQAAASAALNGIFNDLQAPDASNLDIYRNAAIIFGSLAAISFGWARAIDNDSRNKDEIVRAGELFLRVAIFTLVALLFRTYTLQNMSDPPITDWGLKNITGLISMLISIAITLGVCLPNAVIGIIDVALALQNRERSRKKGQSRG